MYKRQVCKKQYSSEKIFNKHLQTKSHHIRTLPGQAAAPYKCVCLQSFTKSQAMYQHRKICKVFNQPQTNSECSEQTANTPQVIQLLQENTQMKEEINALRKQVALLFENTQSNNHTTHNTTNNNDNSTNTTNNIETQNVIIVNSFGNENTEYLTDRIVSKLIKDGPFTCLPKIIERIHFNPEHPENHNIKVTNQKANYAKVIKDRKWVFTNKKRAIDAMIQNSYDILEEKYQDNKESIPPFKQERFESFQEKYTNEDKQLMKNIKNDVDVAVLNGTENIYKNNGDNGEP